MVGEGSAHFVENRDGLFDRGFPYGSEHDGRGCAAERNEVGEAAVRCVEAVASLIWPGIGDIGRTSSGAVLDDRGGVEQFAVGTDDERAASASLLKASRVPCGMVSSSFVRHAIAYDRFIRVAESASQMPSEWILKLIA